MTKKRSPRRDFKKRKGTNLDLEIKTVKSRRGAQRETVEDEDGLIERIRDWIIETEDRAREEFDNRTAMLIGEWIMELEDILDGKVDEVGHEDDDEDMEDED